MKKGPNVKSFTDADTSAWYFNSIDILSSNGVLNGFEDGSFKPNTNMDREQMATIIYNLLILNNVDLTPIRNDLPKDFENVSEYAKLAVKTLYQIGIINGVGDGTYLPTEIATRAEVSIILNNLLEKLGK